MQVLRAVDVLQPAPAELVQHESRRQVVADELGHNAREQDLTAGGGGRDAGAAVEDHAEVPPVRGGRLAGV
jgi:hypothetical protein